MTAPDEVAAAFGSLADPGRIAILPVFTAVVDDSLSMIRIERVRWSSPGDE